MKLPTTQQALEWARSEALKMLDEPTRERKHILVLLHHIKQLEEQRSKHRERR